MHAPIAEAVKAENGDMGVIQRIIGLYRLKYSLQFLLGITHINGMGIDENKGFLFCLHEIIKNHFTSVPELHRDGFFRIYDIMAQQ